MATPSAGLHTWRVYANDNSDVNSCSPVGAEKSLTEVRTLDVPFIIRLGIWNDSAANFNDAITLEFRVDGGSWTPVSGTSSNVRAAPTCLPTDGAACSTQLLASYSTYSWESDGNYDDVDGVCAAVAHAKESFWECAWGIVFRSAELSGGEEIEFRVGGAGVNWTDPTPDYPLVTAQGAEEYTAAGAGTLAAATGAATGAYGYPAGAGAGTLAPITGSAAGTLHEAHDNEATMNAVCYKTEDHAEAVKAFLDKRTPVFKGR